MRSQLRAIVGGGRRDGIPLVFTCAINAAGLPATYRVTVAGGTGDFAALNGVYTLPYVADCTNFVEVGILSAQTAWLDVGGGMKQIQGFVQQFPPEIFFSFNTPAVPTGSDAAGPFEAFEFPDFVGTGDLPTVTVEGV